MLFPSGDGDLLEEVIGPWRGTFEFDNPAPLPVHSLLLTEAE